VLLTGLFGPAYVGGRFPEARDRLEQIRSFTSQQPEPEFLLELHHHDWSIALSTGELETVKRHVEDGLAFYQTHRGSVPVTPYTAHHPAVCGHAWDVRVDGKRSRFAVPGVFEVELAPHVDPTSGKEQEVRVDLPNGFIFKNAQAIKTTVMKILSSSFNFDYSRRNAFFTLVQYQGP
jgi:hypothetical protein